MGPEPPVYRPFALLGLAATLAAGIPLGVWPLAWLYLGGRRGPGGMDAAPRAPLGHPDLDRRRVRGRQPGGDHRQPVARRRGGSSGREDRRMMAVSAGGATPEDPGVGPFADLLGLRRSSMEDGRSRFEVTIRPEHMNPHGVVHGGRAVRHPRDQDQLSRAGLRRADHRRGVDGGPYRANRGTGSPGPGPPDRLVAVATGSFYIQTPRPMADTG